MKTYYNVPPRQKRSLWTKKKLFFCEIIGFYVFFWKKVNIGCYSYDVIASWFSSTSALILFIFSTMLLLSFNFVFSKVFHLIFFEEKVIYKHYLAIMKILKLKRWPGIVYSKVRWFFLRANFSFWSYVTTFWEIKFWKEKFFNLLERRMIWLW